MRTIALTALTLLFSSEPVVMRTAPSATEGSPSLASMTPRSFLARVATGGLTSLMRSSTATAPGGSPRGTMEIVPSAAILIELKGGSATGPLLPSTTWPAPLRNWPNSSMRRSPRRVKPSPPPAS